jgi:hypothetical protein
MVPAGSHGISHVPCYSGSCMVGLSFRLRDYHPLWCNFPDASTTIVRSVQQSYNPSNAETLLVWANPRSLATTEGITIVFFSTGYLDVSVRRVSFLQSRIPRLQRGGLPHSEIPGSMVICTSPRLIAAYHVLHRLWEPRHPPYALVRFFAIVTRWSRCFEHRRSRCSQDVKEPSP